MRAVQPLISMGGSSSSTIRAASAWNAGAGRGCRASDSATGRPASPPSRHRGLERDPRHERRLDLLRRARRRRPRRTARTRSPVGGDELAHVLDDADDLHVRAAGHVGDADRDLLRGERGRGDHEHLGLREHPGEAHLDVAGAGRHVDEQVVDARPSARR